MYDIRDIFFDEASRLASDMPFYTQVCDYVHAAAAGSIVVLNPGVVPDPGYMTIADIVVTYEDMQANYAAFSPPSWVTNGTYPPTRFCNIIHTCTPENLALTIAKAEAVNAGYVYITDDLMPNPYNKLPTYLAAELSLVPHPLRRTGADQHKQRQR